MTWRLGGMAPSASAAAAREERRRKFAEDLASALEEDTSRPSAERKDPKPTTSRVLTVDRKEPKRAASEAVPAAASRPAPKVSRPAAEALAAFYIVNTKPSAVTTKLIELFSDALFGIVNNPRVLLTPGTIVDHGVLRRLLVTSEKGPRVSGSERKQLCEQLSLLGLHLAPISKVPVELRRIKEAYKLAALADARNRANKSDPEDIKIIASELLRAHGERDYPFDELVGFFGPNAVRTGKSSQVALGEPLAWLPTRSPELAKVMRDVVQVYIDKTSKAPSTSPKS